ncbi:HypC/HybG/HupF family hydrogenase formation chaperone [Collinsella tanakaei]|uniref:HypC/HybG/HupF family hydrogenase formation chaperone n=1 Tax=Collinsella tanakaei TaxID=626935 RepID=UPI0025A431C8|nr:HypC/HybG/HupF family hydrogenase formation chaperone [Collinsella tanakaei]MDM8300323.1 HypC/HybG/HupF family hydrogenase formation chaperone [Collinsella tanakaei]
MCLAVPGKIVSMTQDGSAVADMLGARREVSLRLVPDAALGDYVLVHAGFAIQVIDPQEAAETIALMRELDELVEEELPGAAGDRA